MTKLVETVANTISDTRTSKAQTGTVEEEGRIARLILTSFYNAHFVLPKPCKVSVPLTTGAYLKSKPHPQKIRLSFPRTKQVIGALRELGWADEEKGTEFKKKYTRMWAAGGLAALFDTEGLTWHQQQLNDRDKLIVLRDRDPNAKGGSKKKITLLTPDTDDVQLYRDNLFEINSFLTEHCIAIDLTDNQLHAMALEISNGAGRDADEYGDEEAQAGSKSVDFSKVQLRRIFSRGDMKKHGRFYGGWWQSLPERFRAHITIDGYKTCEVDYTAIGLRILYANVGAPLPEDKDPYDIGLPDWEGHNDPRRRHVKRYVSAIINDESGRYKLGAKQLTEVGLTHKELKERVFRTHRRIAHLFATDAGLKAHFTDSQIVERVIKILMKEDVVVLPIHDSFIVRAGYQWSVQAAMKQAFIDITGAKATVTVAGPRLHEHFGLSTTDLQQLSTEPQDTIVDAAQLAALVLNSNSSKMDQYLRSWHQWRNHQQ